MTTRLFLLVAFASVVLGAFGWVACQAQSQSRPNASVRFATVTLGGGIPLRNDYHIDADGFCAMWVDHDAMLPGGGLGRRYWVELSNVDLAELDARIATYFAPQPQPQTAQDDGDGEDSEEERALRRMRESFYDHYSLNVVYPDGRNERGGGVAVRRPSEHSDRFIPILQWCETLLSQTEATQQPTRGRRYIGLASPFPVPKHPPSSVMYVTADKHLFLDFLGHEAVLTRVINGSEARYSASLSSERIAGFTRLLQEHSLTETPNPSTDEDRDDRQVILQMRWREQWYTAWKWSRDERESLDPAIAWLDLLVNILEESGTPRYGRFHIDWRPPFWREWYGP